MIYARTDLVSISFGSVRWFQRYFHPVNEYGYRDLPYSDERLEGKRLLAVLGDSMAAGHGTRDYHDRFSGVLQEEIGDAWVVATLAMIGWGPDLEYDNLMHFPRKPDALVLSVYYNDIEDVTTALDKNFQPVQLQRPNLLTAWFVMHSYTFNFVYWSIVMPTFLHDGAYEAYLAEVLNDEVVWSGFEAKLQPFLDYAAERNIPVAAVVFPMLHRPDITCPFDDNVLAFFREKGVPALSVAECVADLPPEARILNNMDAHPSDLVHERVGHALADLLRESGITTKD
ncbi:MAG: hypothetical protein GC168_03565 [Candidatus Hydrogenedens sp.]|nr:hypothetical protein [Candidatus Hydrogenedens sp.]